MHTLVRAAPAIVLLVSAVAMALFGVTQVLYGFVFRSPVAPVVTEVPQPAGPMLGFVAFGAALVVGAAGLSWLAWASWRSRPWAIHGGLLFTLGALVGSVWVARTAFEPIASAIDPATGQLRPIYETRSIVIALAIVPYAIALVCLAISELRLRSSQRH
jgi:hypothetical protein